jgi:hypothetical protein
MESMTSNRLMSSKILKTLVFGLIATGALFSCKKENALTPEESSLIVKEVGLNNSKVAYSGNDLHIDAEVISPGKIADIKVQITLAESNYGWDFIKSYSGVYSGLKNADFHEHIDIPESARAGTYSLLIIVTDELGRKTQAKVEFEIIKDLSLPRLNDVTLKVTSSTALNVSGVINAPNRIASLVIEVQSSTWTKEFTYTDIDMVDQTTFRFNKDLNLSDAPSGHYHINVTVYDKQGKHALYAYHLDR